MLEDNAIGLELEYENVIIEYDDEYDEPRATGMEHWHTVPDGSLRNGGIEYVSTPIPFADTDAEIDIVGAYLEAQQPRAIATERCGLHVHMNMIPYTVGQVWSLIALYALLEPTIYKTYAIDRETNMFAVPLWANHVQVGTLYRDISYLRGITAGAPVREAEVINTCKYSAMNFQALNKFGTVEMRQPYCTRDMDAIKSWVDFCKRLVENGVMYADPDEILEWYARSSLSELQTLMFGESYEIDIDRQDDAEDAASMVAGYTEPSWQDLTWDIDAEEVA
jgi:hypothetical protein